MLNTLIGRLYIFSIFIVAPFYTLIYLNFDYSRSIVQDELLHTARLVSNQAVENQERLVESTQLFLSSLASSSQIQSPDSEACRQFVSSITPLFGRYVNIGVPNKEGILTCNGTLLDSPVYVNDRDYIKEALSTNRFTTSGLHIDRATGLPAINFAYPVQAYAYSNQVVGAAVAVVSLEWWSKLLSDSPLPEGSVAYILNSDGVVNVSFPSHIRYEEPQSFGTIVSSQDGVKRVFTQQQVVGANNEVLLSFVIGVAVDEPLLRVNKRYTAAVAVFSFLVIATLLLIRWFFIRSITNPLKKLSLLAERLGRNEESIAPEPSIGVKEMCALQGSFIDMAKRKATAEQRIISQSQIDTLTGIANRDAFLLSLEKIIEENQGQHRISVVLIDLDDFKDINSRGHEIGDYVLKTVASRLIHQVPSARLFSRLGSDEFIFILEGEDASKSRTLSVCEKVKNVISQPILSEHGDIELTASMGGSFYPDDGESVKTILSAVDQAIYLAKQQVRNTISFFSEELKSAQSEKMELVKDLRNAIANKELYLVYQPILSVRGEVIKFEALIRWQHPKKGLIAPDRFIGLAEEFGQIREIGLWVIQEAKRALRSIQKVHGDNVQVSVNVSPAQLSKYQSENDYLLEELITECHGKSEEASPNKLIVEITEHLLMNSDESTRKALLSFRDEGIQVALDDFGTGYSSLAYIMNYEIDYLKIDKSFVQKLGAESASETLCETIISMAHTLGVKVIAEGVETREQADLLLAYGCDYLQGFYFSKPLTLYNALSYKAVKIS
ncbi:EAL domain-containing protein [Marinomonas sp. C2222]|uniref:EAL domain-containing protein n=1 Tax=Marinomonas sargassi TaxID=2984494 RepID=A0ABT2YRS8_9GAMM|nr:EAL domain-containing protein [Marinomonas sargassi]MCV2402592.1 EAL domain-containing protein [Marinomonas sargassi]